LVPIVKLDLGVETSSKPLLISHNSSDVDGTNLEASMQAISIPEAINNLPTTTKITKKLKHRSNTLEHKIANKVELND
jgi:hypothetical protein